MAGLPPVGASIMKQRVRCEMQPVIANRSSERCGNPFFHGGDDGFPRQCAHWLGMTGVVYILQRIFDFLHNLFTKCIHFLI